MDPLLLSSADELRDDRPPHPLRDGDPIGIGSRQHGVTLCGGDGASDVR
ncbi:MAG: hypothetical protein ACO3GM_03605 [Candidatus Limnocylindrus sp.]